MTELPHTTVATVVVDDGKFLMVREMSGDRFVYNQPAGHLEVGESLLEAALRETLEETAWHIELQNYLGVYQHQSTENGISYVRHCFTAKPVKQDLKRNLDPDIESVHWLRKNEIIDLQDKLRSPMVLRAIEDYLSGDCFPLSMFRL